MDRQYPTGGYKVPKKNVLLLSCIDLRLTDDLVRFMNHDNLTNRYDHFVLAGVSLGYTLTQEPEWHNHDDDHDNGHYDVRNFKINEWWTTLQEHIGIAIALHDIRDVYIVEHEDCGAYKAFVRSSVLQQHTECGCQGISANKLATVIRQIPIKKQTIPGKVVTLNATCFRMDLRGNIELLVPPKGKAQSAGKQAGASKKLAPTA